ncbi:MAG TPA: alpha-(1-_3)-arabinofuranosyltransferase family protein [Capillimicrobium sp.]|nr:alpha-(1->3)-arabinofuranosyltransferase family protein [Capillimicrobium sp.]
MDSPRRDRLLIPVLAVGCYALALLQRPGWAVSDTKIDLHVDPARFLADAAAPWSSDISLGHVQSGQYGGYVWPMGPFFALLREIGLAPWVVQRLWLGTLLLLAAWGVVRLLDALLGRPRGVAHVVAAAAFVLNPYVVTYTSRVSVSLLAYAALPWLLLFVHRGLRERGWLWPALFALVVTSSGGGINAAVTAWALLGPLLLLLYEPALRLVPWRRAWAFTWRTAVLGAVTSLWWVVPLLVQSKWGLPFLPYTEQAGTIWGSTSASESLRLMGFWLSYAGIGYGGDLVPYTSSAGTYVFWAPGIVGSLLLPALALGGFAWTRRWRYGPFFLAMTLLGVLVMIAGFPEGTPLRKGMTFAYNHLVSLQFLRTTYKAGPLPALGLAVLGGVAAGWAWRWLATRERAPLWRAGLVGGGAVVLALAAWPLVRGRAVEDQITWKAIPSAWREVAADLDRDLGDDRRAMVLPGQLFSYYRWGGTIDPILPTLMERPAAVRQVVPFADLRSVELQWSTDALISQRRAVPGQLDPLLDLQSVGAVVTASDDDRHRSGAVSANAAARELARSGYRRPDAAYGPRRRVRAEAGEVAAAVTLPEIRRYDRDPEPMVRLLPRDRATVVDGSAGGIVDLAAFGRLDPSVPLRYAADLEPEQLRELAANGSRVVITDSNRRRVFVPSQLRANQGATLAPDDPISEDGHQLNPWPDRDTDVQTVAQLDGVRWVRAPFSPQIPQFPEHRPFAALDGDPATAWVADRTLTADRWHLDVALERPADVPYVDLLPYGDERGRVKEVAVNGRRFAVHDGWNRLPVDLRGAGEIRVDMVDVTDPPDGVEGGAGGIRELRIPGVHAREALRPPTVAEHALAGADLSRTPLSYVLERTRGADPYHRIGAHGPWSAGSPRDAGDGELGLERILAPPAARRWDARAWVSVSPQAPDHVLDRIAGGRVEGRFDSSSRYAGEPRFRASSAFDGRPRTAWIGDWTDAGGASLTWTTPRRTSISTLRLTPPHEVVRRPAQVRLVADGEPGPAVAVAADGTVALPAPQRGRAFRLEILDAAFPAGSSGLQRERRAVGIAEVLGAGTGTVAPRRSGRIEARCAVTLSVGDRSTALTVRGSVASFDRGEPLRAASCRGPLELPAGEQRLSAPAGGTFRVDLLELDSPAPAGAPVAPSPPGRVAGTGTPGRGERRGIELEVERPAWVVLGESYTTGWRATCDGRDLGDPVPLQGYAVGWPVEPGCETVDVVFAGNAPVTWSAWISLVASLALAGFAGVALWRRRRRRAAERAPALDPDAVHPDRLRELPVAAMPLKRALAWGVAAALAGGFVFALRAGVVIGPAVAFVLWRGIGARQLALAAGALLTVVVPVLYLAVPVEDRGGYNTAAPLDRIAAHWVAVAAIVLLLLALYRALAGVRTERARRPSASTPAAATH